MYLFVLSSVLADSHPGKPARLSGNVGVPHFVGRRHHCFHKAGKIDERSISSYASPVAVPSKKKGPIKPPLADSPHQTFTPGRLTALPT